MLGIRLCQSECFTLLLRLYYAKLMHPRTVFRPLEIIIPDPSFYLKLLSIITFMERLAFIQIDC